MTKLRGLRSEPMKCQSGKVLSCALAVGLAMVACGTAADISPYRFEVEPAARPAAMEQPAACAYATRSAGSAATCWTVVQKPTLDTIQWLRSRRAEHAAIRESSSALQRAVASACRGVDENDLAISPFEHIDDIARVEPLRVGGQEKRLIGAIVTFRDVPGLTKEHMARIVECHLAMNAARNHVVPESPSCPLVPAGAEATVVDAEDGIAVLIRGPDLRAAREIHYRAERLLDARRAGEGP